MALLSVRERRKTKTNSCADLFKRVHHGSVGVPSETAVNRREIIEFPWHRLAVPGRQSLLAIQLMSTRRKVRLPTPPPFSFSRLVRSSFVGGKCCFTYVRVRSRRLGVSSMTRRVRKRELEGRADAFSTYGNRVSDN